MSAMSKLNKGKKKKPVAHFIQDGRTYVVGDDLPDGRKVLEIVDGIPILSKKKEKDRGTTIVKTTPTSTATDKNRKLMAVPEKGKGKPAQPSAAVPFEMTGLDEDFKASVLHRQKASEREKKWKGIKDEESKRILLILETNHFRSVLVEKYQATVVPGKVTKTIDGMALLKAGVSADVIAACTIESTGSPYIMVSDTEKKRGGKKE